MTCTPEQHLWMEVLCLAVEDAIYGPPKEVAASASAYRFEIIRAREYVTTPNRDFDRVCSLAGVDPEAARDRLLRQIADASTVDEIAKGAPRPVKRIRKIPTASCARVPSQPAPPKPTRRKTGKRRVSRRQAETYTHEGLTLTVPQWAKRAGLHKVTIYDRLRRGFSIGDAVSYVAPIGRPKKEQRQCV